MSPRLDDPNADAIARAIADLLEAGYRQRQKDRNLAGDVHDVFPYDPARRSGARRAASHSLATRAAQPASA